MQCLQGESSDQQALRAASNSTADSTADSGQSQSTPFAVDSLDDDPEDAMTAKRAAVDAAAAATTSPACNFASDLQQ